MSTLRPMRRALFVAIFFVSAPAAHAAPNVSISPSGVIGQAPFAVTLTAVGAADTYSWDLGDGTRAEGQVVHHAYATGRYTATLTATQGGETAQAKRHDPRRETDPLRPGEGNVRPPGADERADQTCFGRRRRRVASGRGRRRRSEGRQEGALPVPPAARPAGELSGRLRPGPLERGRTGGAAETRHLDSPLAHDRPAPRDRCAAASRGCGVTPGSRLARRTRARAEVTRQGRRDPTTHEARDQLRPAGDRRAGRRVRARHSHTAHGGTRPLPVRGLTRAECPHPRAPPPGARVCAPRHRRSVRARHDRSDPGVPEAARPPAHGARRPRALGPAAESEQAASPLSRDTPGSQQGSAKSSSTCAMAKSSASSTSRPARRETRPSAAGASTASPEGGTGCSGTRCTSCAASPSTATPRYPPTPRRTAASGCRCGSRPASSQRTRTARGSTSTRHGLLAAATAVVAFTVALVAYGFLPELEGRPWRGAT